MNRKLFHKKHEELKLASQGQPYVKSLYNWHTEVLYMQTITRFPTEEKTLK